MSDLIISLQENPFPHVPQGASDDLVQFIDDLRRYMERHNSNFTSERLKDEVT